MRLKTAKIIKDSKGNLYYSMRKKLEYEYNDAVVYYEVEPGDRLDLISYKFYADPSLWWAIADYNDLKDAFDIQPGDIIKIPPYQKILGLK